MNYCENIKKKYSLTYETYYTGHTTHVQPESKYKDITRDHINWLHAAGTSSWKQTDAVISAWKKHPEWPKLTLICRDNCIANLIKYKVIKNKNNIYKFAKNIVYHEKVDDLNKLQYTITNHICPSMMEGYGHYINEGRAYGAFVVTSDAAPMNELIDEFSGYLIPCSRVTTNERYPLVDMCETTSDDIATSMKKILKISSDERNALGQEAKKRFALDSNDFNKHMKAFVLTLESHIKKIKDKTNKKNIIEISTDLSRVY